MQVARKLAYMVDHVDNVSAARACIAEVLGRSLIMTARASSMYLLIREPSLMQESLGLIERGEL